MIKMNQIIADYNSLKFETLMSEKENWFFDTHGYMIVKNVITKDEANYLIDKFESWSQLPDEKVPHPLKRSLESTVFQNMHYVDEKYQDLILNHRIMKYVSSILLHNPRLMFSSVIKLTKDQKRKKHPNKNQENKLQKFIEDGNVLLHRDTNGYNYPFESFINPLIGYQVVNGIIHSGYVNVSVTLVDVPDDHGIGLIPGSHKSNFNTPLIESDDPYKEYIQSFELTAGDAIVFVPNLLHTSRKWELDYPRYTIFNRYVFGKYIDEGYSSHAFEEYKDNINDELYELEKKNIHQEKKIVSRLKNIYQNRSNNTLNSA
jgi:ectoine hydroxylase-related dioxygenase (phytanoyl-CoA dioxygenase family)